MEQEVGGEDVLWLGELIGKGRWIVNIDEVRRVLVIGAGTMGRQIAMQCAMFGYHVVIYDAQPGVFEGALAEIDGTLRYLVGQGHLPTDQAQAALARIVTSDDPAAAAQGVDLVSESVPEDPQLKGRIFGQFHALCPPRTVFTTNTSTLVPSQFAAATGRPAQFAALHFHSPVWLSNVVDIMPHPGTAAETIAMLEAFARRIGQIPIVLHKENHSFVFNNMLNAIIREALTLAANEVTSIENIDRAWMGVMKMPIGPFGIIDQIGIDTVYHITAYWAGRLTFDQQLRANAGFLKPYVDQGWLGKKSGRGFYTYPQPAFEQPGFVEGRNRS